MRLSRVTCCAPRDRFATDALLGRQTHPQCLVCYRAESMAPRSEVSAPAAWRVVHTIAAQVEHTRRSMMSIDFSPLDSGNLHRDGQNSYGTARFSPKSGRVTEHGRCASLTLSVIVWAKTSGARFSTIFTRRGRAFVTVVGERSARFLWCNTTSGGVRRTSDRLSNSTGDRSAYGAASAPVPDPVDSVVEGD